MSGQHRAGVRRSTWLALAWGLAVAGAVCLVMWGAHTARTPPDQPAAVQRAESVTEARASVTAPARRAQHARHPVELNIPAIGVTTRLTGLGLHRDGTVQVPADPALAGWYRRGTVPGAVGSAVILGHVDSTSGPAVFYRLSELEPGETVRVRLDDGTDVRFVVRTVRVYPNDEFPDRRVYGAHGRRELNLVTCGGAYDAARGGYQANVVINALRS